MAVAGSLVAPAVNADDQRERRIHLAATLGYAAPIGDAERGGRVSDTTLGAVPIAVDVAYRFASHVGVAARLQYGIGIPTLCQTASDCESSLGSDVIATLAGRIDLPEAGPLAPDAEVGIGYEWLTTRRSDAGAHSIRAYHGPIVLWLGLLSPFRIASHWSFGPTASIAVGTFVARSLETNVASVSGAVPERGVHTWVSLGARLEHAF